MNGTHAHAPAYPALVLLAAFMAALLINLALLLLISMLISQREAELVSRTTPQPIEFIRVIPKPTEQKPVPQSKQNKVDYIAPRQERKEKSVAPKPVKQPKAVSPKLPKPVAVKHNKNTTISAKVTAPKIIVPEQGTGPEFAAVPGTDSRLTAPPAAWNVNKTAAAKVAQGDGTGTGSGGSGTQNLTVLSRVVPRYPHTARERGIEGWVRLEIVVTPEGTVSEAKVVEASPKQTFDQAALEAIRRWRFKPTYKDGQAIEQRAVQRISFKLKKPR